MKTETNERILPNRKPTREVEQHSGVVYKITCLITKEKYTGGTTDYDRRMNEHRLGKTALRESVAKHGWENHEQVKLAQGIPDESLRRCELAFEKIVQPEINKRTTGISEFVRHTESSKQKLSEATRRYFEDHPEARAKHSVSMKKHYEAHPESRARMSAVRKGVPVHTPEHRANLSKAYKGENNPNFGKKHSLETRAKQSAANKDIPKSPKHRANMQIAQRERRRVKHIHNALKELRAIGWPVAA